MIITLAALLVLLTGLYLVALSAFSLIYPARAVCFLEAFASSAFTHLLELSLRLTVGVAFLLYAPYMRFTGIFRIFGWVLIATTIGLFAIPWRWHHRFAQWAVPFATRRLGMFAIGSLTLGVFIVLSVLFGEGILGTGEVVAR